MIFAAEGLRAVAAVPSSSKIIPKDPDICRGVTRKDLMTDYAIKRRFFLTFYAILFIL